MRQPGGHPVGRLALVRGLLKSLRCSLMFPILKIMSPRPISPSDQAERERVGATLRELRERDGWKLGDFANALNISYAYLSNIEAGRKPLTNQLLTRAARILGCPRIAIKHPVSDRTVA